MENKGNQGESVNPAPCSKEAFCAAMQQALETANFYGKGLSVPPVLNFRTGEHKLYGVVYKNDRRHVGIMLNLCPWCGADLKWWPEQPESATGGDR